VSSRRVRQRKRYRQKEELGRERKQLKRNRKPKRARQKGWTPASSDEWDEIYDVPQSERIMPLGEHERRRTGLREDQSGLEQTRAARRLPTAQERTGERGRVIEVSSSLCRVDLAGHELVCGIRGSLSAEESGYSNVVAVGDEVIVSRNGSAQGTVEAVLPRRSVLARPDVFHDGNYRTRDRGRQQVVAANVDQLLIVASWREPHLWPELVDRYLIAAERYHLTPIICVNKVDLVQDMAECRAELQPYLDLECRVLFTSARTGKGIGKLRRILCGRTTVLAGMSGVGKSSLLEAVQPGLGLRTGEVSAHSGEGRHTTAQVSWLRLEMGGCVVDTPGIREFGLSGLRRAELARFYPEIAAIEEGCQFKNCSHTHEPGCAVKVAMKRGDVSATRYRSYNRIYDDLPS
jgi:ribosome biogenesis GTPase